MVSKNELEDEYSRGFEDGRMDTERNLLKYKVFYDHIKAHFEKEHPDWEVLCKICNQTFDQIVLKVKHK